MNDAPDPAAFAAPLATATPKVTCPEPAWSEEERLAALDRYAILDTAREPAFDELVAYAADLFDAPIAVVNLIAADRQWFKAEKGIGADSLPLDVSICRHAIVQPGVFVVPDLSDDLRFAGNPLVHVAEGLRFYAGALLETADGLPLGTICVLDTKPRPAGVSDHQARALVMLARQAMAQLEMRRSQRALEDAQARLRLATSGAGVGIWELDLVADRGRWSDEAVALFGVHRAEFTGADWVEAVHPDDRAAAAEAWRRAVEEGARYETEFRGASPAADGGERWLLSRGRVEKDASGRPARGAGVLFDVTTRRRSEQALRDSEARFRALFEQSPALIHLFAPDGRTLMVNPALERAFGLPAEKIADYNVLEDPQPHADGTRAILERVFFAGEAARAPPVQHDAAVQLGAGRAPWIETVGFPIKDERGRVREVVLLSQDVSERVEAQAALAGSEAAFRLRLNTLPQIVWSTLPDGYHDFYNDRWYEVTGVPRGSVDGDGWAGLFHPDDQDTAWARWRRCLETGEPYEVEYRLRHASGDYRWVLGRALPIRGEDGAIVRWMGTCTDIHDRHEADARLRQALAAGRMMMWAFDLDTGTSHRSDGMDGVLGLGTGPADDFLSRIHPEDRAAQAAALQDALDGVAAYDLEFRVARADGGYMWVADRAEVERDENGRPRCMVGVLTDITRRREAEAAVRDSQGRLDRATAAAGVGIWEMDVATGATSFNAEYFALYGLPTDGPGPSFDEWIANVHPEDQDRARAAALDAVAGGSAYRDEYRIIRRDTGELRWISARGVALRDVEGRVAIFTGVNIDVTDRRLLEGELAASEEQFRTTAEALPGLLFLTAPNGGNIYVNEGFRAYTGLPAEALLGHGWAEIIHPDDLEAASEEWSRAAAAGEAFHAEYRIRRHDGEWRWHETRSLPVRDGHGAVLRWIGSSIDVHERRMVEDELQRRVAARTAELEQVQDALRQSQKLEAMGQLTGGVAHDFNNLLTPIVGGLDMLQRRGLGGEREQRIIAAALQSADRAKTLVQRLLAFARRQPLQTQAIDVGALVRGMAELVASTTGPQIKVRVEAAPDLPPALADANQVEMAILNLSVNARDAMPDGGTLTIAAEAGEVRAENGMKLAAGRYVRLSVADTGVGMDEDTARRAIEPFFSTKGIGKGTGLGLSMAHGLAAQLGGALDIRSAPGLGTRIDLWLPVAGTTPRAEDRPMAATAGPAAGTALLVDDEEPARTSTADMLADMGYAVTEAASAEEALRTIADGLRPDLLVTDHLMPGMTGTELAREVRARLPGVPVLLISGYADVDGIAPELSRLTKPFRHADLAEAIAGAMPAAA